MGDSTLIDSKLSHDEQIKNLMKYSRDYKKLFHTKFFNRKELILHRSIKNNIEQLKTDKNTKKAQIWVAKSVNNTRQDEQCMDKIECHIHCQENLIFENKKIKQEIAHLERQNLRADKEIFQLNRRTVPDNQHQAHVAKVRKTFDILENQLDVSIKRECLSAAQNDDLRETLIRLLNHRGLFNHMWSKMIQELNSGKKYLTDLVEMAASALEHATETYEKIDAVTRRENRDKELRKMEIQEAARTETQNAAKNEFLTIKAKKRSMTDLEPREYKRRDIFRKEHQHTLSLYNQVLKNLLNFSNSTSIEKVIENFEHQEGLYYSYFNYTNEMGYYMTLLNNGIHELYSSIHHLRRDNQGKLQRQLDIIDNLQLELKNEQIKTTLKFNEQIQIDNNLENLFQGLHSIFTTVNCDKAPLMILLGNHDDINIFNVQRFLRILEHQLNAIVAKVYIMQKREKGPRRKGAQLVRDVTKIVEAPTDLDHVVLVTQCPECAEGEDVNPYDAEYVEPLSTDMVKNKYREKVMQPEMQYRLHALGDCRLPRSRVLSNKR